MKILLKTFGCQMNVYDSQLASGILEKEGFKVIEEPEESDGTLSGDADVVLMNTCSVRDHAEQRVFSRLGKLIKEKKKNSRLIVGLLGCMVEEHREQLFKRFPQLDLLVGTRNIKELPGMIRQVSETRKKVSQIKQDGISIEYSDHTKRDSLFHAWLPIMTGCDKVCTFCVVPKTRGSEISMPSREVCREAERLVADGVKWITLLGQNVNSYSGDQSFPQLLEMLCKIDGLERVSFTTSYPSDATEELFQVIARNPKIGRRFHLPLQSGSNKILKRMKRLHNYEEFKTKIERLRELAPDISITTDIIVGFSGETEEDFQATKKALKEIRFDGAYIYKYSVREGTPAAKLPDDVPPDVKATRHSELLAIKRGIVEEKNQRALGTVVNAFVDGKKGTGPSCEWFCRMDHDKRVVVSSKEDLLGRFIKVKLAELRNETFRGELV